MDKLLVALVSCCLLLGVTSLQLPANTQKCSIKDTNLNTCALNSAKQALPNIIKGDGEHLIPILDPLFVSGCTVHDEKFEYGLSNMWIRGFKDLDLESIRFDLHNKNITVEGRLPALKFTGDYVIRGKFLEHQISGQGQVDVSYLDTSVKYSTTYTVYRHDDGQQYLVLMDYHLDLVPEDIKIYMGNLFNGNKVLGNEMNKYMNKNWRAILDQFRPKGFESLGLILHNIFSHATTTVPYTELFNDIE